MKFLILLVLVALCHASEDAADGPVVCPSVIYYNTTFWQAHFDMTFDSNLGLWWKTEYVSEEVTDDLPPMFPEGAERPFAMHAYMLAGEMDKMWFVKYPADQIIHWYQGAAFVIYIIDAKTGEFEKRVLNARNVVTVVEADKWTAGQVRVQGKNRYVLMGCTMAPSPITEDMIIATPGDIQTSDKVAQRKVRYFTRPQI